MDAAPRHIEIVEHSGSRSPRREQMRHDTGVFLKGVILGFGLAAVASTLFNLFAEQREERKKYSSPHRSGGGTEGKLGDLSYVIDESTSAFRDAVKTLDRTFESGVKAVESVQEVIDKIRDV